MFDHAPAGTPSDLPPRVFTPAVDKTWLMHQVISKKMGPLDRPRFDGKPVRHWRTGLCRRASRQGLTRFYGGDYNRVEICPCGRDRSWPAWSEHPTSAWLGQTGRAGRLSWSQRDTTGQ